MENTTIKIIILVTLVIAVTVGILSFRQTVVSPPDSVTIVNLHKQALEDNISAFDKKKDSDFNDSIYNKVISILKIYESEKFLTEEEIDFQTKSLVESYLPIFIKQSNAKFAAPIWKESDHKAMLKRIKHLRTLKIDYGVTNAVSDSLSEELNKIENTIQLYNEARKAASHNRFYSVDDATTKIIAAEQYQTTVPLNNCVELVDDLSAVKVNIGESHYNKVIAKVEELTGYRYMKKIFFDSLVVVVSDIINEYESNCSIYVNYQSANEINKKANDYYKEAIKYYHKQEININTGTDWVYMTSPNNSYRAYQSNNSGKPNSTARMSFTVKGYESFTFYVRSKGEAKEDFLMVGLDQPPTENNNYASTKEYPQSGTSLYHYKTVTINNMIKSETYTIYIVYCKDSSLDIGTDKGYVLIPYEDPDEDSFD